MKLYILKLDGDHDYVGAFTTKEKCAQMIENFSFDFGCGFLPKEKVLEELVSREAEGWVYLYADDYFSVTTTFLDDLGE